MSTWMNSCVDRCMGRWMSGWICGQRKSLRKSIKSSGEQLWHFIHPVCCSPLSLSPGPIPSAPPCRLAWVLWNGLGESVMRVAGAHRSQPGSSSSGSWSQQHGMKYARLETQACHSSACLGGPTSRVLAKGAPDCLASSQHWAQCQAHSKCSVKIWWVEISWSSLDGTKKQAMCNGYHPLVREKDRVSWTVSNLTFQGRHKSDLISFQGNKFFAMSLPSAFCDINQASIGSFFAYRLKSIFLSKICTVSHNMTLKF